MRVFLPKGRQFLINPKTERVFPSVEKIGETFSE
jgi:hypothetical protein